MIERKKYPYKICATVCIAYQFSNNSEAKILILRMISKSNTQKHFFPNCKSITHTKAQIIIIIIIIIIML